MTIEEKFKQALAEAWPVGTTFDYPFFVYGENKKYRVTVTRILFSIDENSNIINHSYEVMFVGPVYVSHDQIMRNNPTRPEAQ